MMPFLFLVFDGIVFVRPSVHATKKFQGHGESVQKSEWLQEESESSSSSS